MSLITLDQLSNFHFGYLSYIDRMTEVEVFNLLIHAKSFNFMDNHKLSEIQISYFPKIIDTTISDSKSSYGIALSYWNLNTIEILEEVKVIFLNNAFKIIGFYNLSKGGISSTVVDIRLVLSIALKSLATHIVLVHNHPSTHLKPSKADMDITQKLKTGCDFLEIKLLDHLIINKKSYFSFADEGLL